MSPPTGPPPSPCHALSRVVVLRFGLAEARRSGGPWRPARSRCLACHVGPGVFVWKMWPRSPHDSGQTDQLLSNVAPFKEHDPDGRDPNDSHPLCALCYQRLNQHNRRDPPCEPSVLYWPPFCWRAAPPARRPPPPALRPLSRPRPSPSTRPCSTDRKSTRLNSSHIPLSR